MAMTNPTNRPPLWEVMREASHTADAIGIASTDQFMRACAAAELRAIADEAEKQFACFTDTSGRIVAETMVNWLRAEADRAEAGG